MIGFPENWFEGFKSIDLFKFINHFTSKNSKSIAYNEPYELRKNNVFTLSNAILFTKLFWIIVGSVGIFFKISPEFLSKISKSLFWLDANILFLLIFICISYVLVFYVHTLKVLKLWF